MKPGGYDTKLADEHEPFQGAAGAYGTPQQAIGRSASEWRDLPFAVAFILHLIGVAILIVIGSRTPIDCDKYNGLLPCTVLAWNDSYIQYLEFIGSIALVGIAFTVFYVQLLRTFAKPMIYIGIGVSILSWLGGAVYFFTLHSRIGTGAYVSAAVFGLMGLLMILYFFLVRHRIAFAAEVVEAVAFVIQQHPGTQIVAYVSILVDIAWISMWITAAFFAQRFMDTTSYYIANVFLLLSFYWTLEVIKNVVHVTVSGVVATWYFMSNNMPPSPTLSSLKRSLTTSFGSIAFGSLIVGILKTLRALARSSRDSRNILMLILRCLLACLDRLVQYFNHYAFCQVAIYGKTYLEAAKATWDLLLTSGLEAIVNDNIIDGVLWMGVLLGAFVTGGAGAGLSLVFITVHPIAGFFTGFMVGLIFMIVGLQVVDSAVACTFVCFAEDKETLRILKPDLYQRLMETYYHIV